ncbi:DUF2303 family protein [Curtobacterium sp. DN_7.5]|uniref:DUF2303 family protein n=1 Tax=Curtobacterium sp. DN_7.5 TaxID=3049047 RepID=UPI001F570504|nr:DUF2303 family protein [Curtobacterium sp. DN_7.5]
MTDYTDNPEAAVVAGLAQQAVHPEELETGVVYVEADGSGGSRIVDTDRYAANPRHIEASRVVGDAESFVRYVTKHVIAGHTEVYADVPSSSVVAMIDSHDAAVGGWQKHRAQLELRHTKSWEAWTKVDGKLLEQTDFAEFIEQQSLDVRSPETAVLIEIAQSFQAKTSVDFEGGERLDSGQVRLEYKETVTAKAGQKGHIDIPTELELLLRPYIGGPVYVVVARFRYRLRGSQLGLGIVLQRPQEILDAAFADIVTEIRDGKTVVKGDEKTVVHEGIPSSVPIFSGRP